MTPFRERHRPAGDHSSSGINLYSAQEDYLFEQQKSQRWSWTVARAPLVLDDFGFGITLAIYAVLCKAQGKPLIFPGGKDAWQGLREFVDPSLLTDSMIWMTTHRRCINETFNVSNGSFYRWCELWPLLAEYWGLESVCPELPLDLVSTMADQELVWQQLVSSFDLEPFVLKDLVTWSLLQDHCSSSRDCFSDLTKLRSFGFSAALDSFDSFAGLFRSLTDRGMLPSPEWFAPEKCHRKPISSMQLVLRKSDSSTPVSAS
jgi:hypothetical protein